MIIEEALQTLGFDREIGISQGGWYTTQEVASRTVFGLSHAISPVDVVARFHDPARVHEFIHCLDVGFGAMELMLQIIKDPQARERLSFPEEIDGTAASRAAFISGVGHDVSLSLRGDALPEVTPEQTIVQRIDAREVPKVVGKAQYHKDPVGDDLRGALILVGLYSAAHRRGTAPSGWQEAVSDLEAGSDLKVNRETPRLLGRFSPYKVLDAIWYHDGNFPIRGYAEADLLVGDRIKLWEEGKVSLEVVGAGIQKLLGYTLIDERWAERSTKADPAYLEKMITKKAGPFLQAIEGTPTYDFIVDDLCHRGRSFRTLRSPAFLRGVEQMPKVLHRAYGHQEVCDAYGADLDTLTRRYEEAQAIIKGGK